MARVSKVEPCYWIHCLCTGFAHLNGMRNLLFELSNFPLVLTYGEKCFQFAEPKEWNNLPLLIRESPSIYIFKSRLKTYLFNCAFNYTHY